MDFKIHDIYDVILKIIILVYGVIFLEYVGIDKKIKKVLKTEFTRMDGSKVYLDFLCLLEDDTLCHIEFQFPKARPVDLDRFFDYNITAQVRHGSLTETLVINFTSSKNAIKPRQIGESKSFHPKHFYLGDIDFKEYWRKINIKAESNLKLNGFEEISLMLMCLLPECKIKAKILDKISKLLKKEELFDNTRLDYIQSVIRLEIDNLISEDEKNKIKEEIDVGPEAAQLIVDVIGEVNRKILYEREQKGREDGKAEGLAEGLAEGKAEGKVEAMKEMAVNLSDVLSVEEIAERTGLTVEKVKKLIG